MTDQKKPKREKLKADARKQKRADGGLAGNVSGGWDLTTNKVYA